MGYDLALTFCNGWGSMVGMNVKKVGVLIVLVFCCVTVIPMCVLLIEAMTCSDYNNSTLAGLIEQMD